MANTYDVGDVVRLTSAFKQGATPVDPDTVSVKVKLPNGSTTTYTYPATITKDSAGNYHLDLATSVSGTHRYRWFSTGFGAASAEQWFQVRTQLVP